LALAPDDAKGGYLIASSQGDNAYVLYRLDNGRFAGRFRLSGGAIDGTQETDGIEVMLGDFGPNFPGGLLVAQDSDNSPDTQNFKYAAWVDVLQGLGINLKIGF
jgi:myo-inositol-hexaphosphate 3-phosphohydrolase